MDRYKLMKIAAQFMFAIVIVLCVFVLLLNFNIISFSSSDLPLALTLNQTEVGVKVGKSYQLEANVFPTNVYYGHIEWSSSNPKIATVNSATGYIETHNIGDVIITAKVPLNNLVAECILHVVDKEVLVTKINILNDKINLAIGKSYTIKYNVTPKNSTTHNFNFISSDTSVAVVNEKGVIKAVGEGTAIITMKSKLSSVKDTVLVNVYRYSNSSNNNSNNNNNENNGTYADTGTYYKTDKVNLSKTSLQLVVGAQTKLTATVSPSNASQKINWSSSNSGIVQVNSNGVLTAKKKGTANIIASSIDGVTSICKVTVTDATNSEIAPGIDISLRVLKLEVGATKLLDVNFYLVDSNKVGITWSSSNKDIVSVEDGLVSARSVGTCIVKATSSDGKYSDYVTITVSPASKIINLESIKFNTTSYQASVNDTITLKPVVSPSNATYRFLTWTTSNRNIATVENGVVRCNSEGTVTITATSGNISSSVTINVSSVNPSSIVIENADSSNNINLTLNETKYLVKKIVPSNATNQSVTWKSSNSSIVTVDSNGMIKGVGRGTTTITVKTVNDKTATVNITVS